MLCATRNLWMRRSTWRPFDEAESDFNDTRDAIMAYRRAQLSGADRFRRFSTWNLLAIEGAAIVVSDYYRSWIVARRDNAVA